MRARILGVAAGVTALLPATAEAVSDAPRSTYATSYCLHGRMADGTYTRRRSAASNVLRLGTRIKLTGRSFFGLRRFVIRDTGSALGDGHLDLWADSCSRSIAWGRRTIRYRVTGR